ncbi:ABC transporter permease [Lutibacter sp. B2]|nr:ABC transporter permease [Lutibacter sp. B2]
MKLKKNLALYIGVGIVAILLFLMIISLFYTPYDANKMVIAERFQAPSIKHWLGTDNFGRDILSRIMEGSQTAFYVGTVSVLIALIGGIIIGALAGYMGGWVDEVVMRIIDALMAFPSILLALVFIAVFGVSTQNTMLAIGIRSIPTFARIARSGFIQYKEFEFVKAAKAIGAGPFRIMFIHILPNVMSSLIIAASMGFATAVLAEAGLSYLGLGVQPPHPSWGRMLNEAQGYLMKAPWYTFAPGTVITMSVLGFNLLGDGIRDMCDTRK